MDFLALVERTFAVVVGSACVVLLARQFIGAGRRQRLDGALRRGAYAVRAFALGFYRWPRERRMARRQAEEAIRRAWARQGERDGNVVRPDSLRKPRKLH
ncbi:MAG TPA: hypothetical protein VF319_02425 [Caldimonas sp.]